jgi:serine/threonine-protein kinase RsbW
MKYPAALCLQAPSTPGAIDALCVRARSWLREKGLESDWFAVSLLLRESLNNAVLHGNRNDPELCVDCELRLGRRWLSISVGDSGAGFAWARRRKHRARCEDTSGRGLEIYRIYADKVVFNRKGNRVLLRRELRNRGQGGVNTNRTE